MLLLTMTSYLVVVYIKVNVFKEKVYQVFIFMVIPLFWAPQNLLWITRLNASTGTNCKTRL